MFPHFFRSSPKENYNRERILTNDGDFIDLDWSTTGSRRLAIVAHGLEGSSQSTYIRAMIRALNRSGWDAVVWNMRGCSGKPNRLLRWYHSGDTADLKHVFAEILFRKIYDSIALVGFSLGGNVLLKFLGEQSSAVKPLIAAAAVVSVPCDLRSAAEELARSRNRIYMRYLMKNMQARIVQKWKQFPLSISMKGLLKMRTFREFDDAYTAPIHGFKDALEYWEKCSSRNFIGSIEVPTLILNAKNDPFLGPECHPVDETRASSLVTLENPTTGGHVGFVSFNRQKLYWHEARIVEFLNQHVPVPITA